MFAPTKKRSTLSAALFFGELVYHGIVRILRKNDGNAILGLVKSMSQTVLMVVIFFVMLHFLGMRRMAIRGDYFLYLMSGIFIFMTHVKTVGAVAGSEGPTSPMMQHAPMNTLIAILSAAGSVLYIQILTVSVMLFVYHAAWAPITIEEPIRALGLVILAWYVGIGVGLIFLAIKPWFPGVSGVGSTIYTRINLFASGKLVVGNSLPFNMLPFFTWNPLFHIIDQIRGSVFINYNPHFSYAPYAFYVGTALIMIGFIGEGYTRRHSSLSWFATR